MHHTIVEYFGEQVSNHCGYCKTQTYDKFSHGMWSHTLTVQDYQDFMDRGWRRSGKYTYKPTMHRTCCPQYTIRCSALDFKLSKSQKRVVKRMHNFLSSGQRPSKSAYVHQQPRLEFDQPPMARPTPSAVSAPVESVQLPAAPETSKALHSEKTQSDDKSEIEKPKPKAGVGADPDRPVCRKAKHLRRERRLQMLAAKGLPVVQKSPKISQPLPLETRLERALPANPAHKLELRLARTEPADQVFDESFGGSHQCYWKYQTVVHGDPPDKPSERQFRRFLCDSPLSGRDYMESYRESLALFQKYQKAVHGDTDDDCDQDTFENFLCMPLIFEPSDVERHPGYGSFHQQYLLDGKIIAVGVIDILPNCVSSKYFYYDPDYMFLSLGTYSALREVALVRSLCRMSAELKYYYMGFYIHNCPKMRYKGHYYPSFLLCPEVYTWQPIEKCRPKLDHQKYSRLDESDAGDVNGEVDVNDVLVLHKRTPMPYVIYKERNPRVRDGDEIEEYKRLVGNTCARRILLFRK